MEICCSKCGKAYQEGTLEYCCPICDSPYDIKDPLPYDKTQVDHSQPGIWKYRHTFGLSREAHPISLGEGNTPLVWAKAFGRNVGFKCEFLNPSGSFKDRGSAVIISWLKSLGVTEVVEDSSGNAGASLAAYAARAGIKARIFIPASASGPKRRQIEAYGAELTCIPGKRSDVTKSVRDEAINGIAYASHAYLPFNLPGYATTSYEIFEQLGNEFPGAVVVPVGQGGMLLGVARGFDALRIANNSKIPNPKYIGVQAKVCSPLWNYSGDLVNDPRRIEQKPSLAEGVCVSNPLRGEAVIAAIRGSGGTICVVEEQDILAGRAALSRLGFYVEPTSAIVWSGLEQIICDLPDPVIVVLTGFGCKYE